MDITTIFTQNELSSIKKAYKYICADSKIGKGIYNIVVWKAEKITQDDKAKIDNIDVLDLWDTLLTHTYGKIGDSVAFELCYALNTTKPIKKLKEYGQDELESLTNQNRFNNAQSAHAYFDLLLIKELSEWWADFEWLDDYGNYLQKNYITFV